MKNKSLWLTTNFKTLKSIDNNITTDYLIIGGGITGLSILDELKKNNLNVILVEQNICGEAVTSKTTAKITYLQQNILSNIRTFRNNSVAQTYLTSQIKSMNYLVKKITKEKINCDLKPVASYLYTQNKNNINIIENEYTFFKSLNITCELQKEVPFTKDCLLALKVSDTYVFHPLKYLNYLKNKYQNFIYEKSLVKDIQKTKDTYLVKVNNYLIKTKNIILATHYPYFLLPYLTPLKTYLETSYIGVKKVNKTLNISAINVDKPTISLRYHEDNNNKYLIYLYNSLPTSNVKNIKDNFAKLTKQMNFDYIWSNKDIITSDYLPYIGPIKKNDHSFLVAFGYNTWGMTNATLASIIIRDIILKNDNPYLELTNPLRHLNLGKIINYPLNILKSIKAIVKSTPHNINNQNIISKTFNKQKILTYIDELGQEYSVLAKCPHMKCGIIFNETEKTWDCLCHGSRFDIDGNLLEGPSNCHIKFLKSNNLFLLIIFIKKLYPDY